MTNFIKDNTPLSPAKSNFRNRPDVPADQKVVDTDWNEHRTSLLDIQSYLRGGLMFTSITPAALPLGSTDNYNPVDAVSGASWTTVAVIRQATNASGSTLTGLVAQANGSSVLIQNIGPNALTLAHDTGSTAANRFTLHGGVNLVLQSGGAVLLIYDATSSRWRQAVSPASSAVSGVGSGTTNKVSKFTGASTVGDSQISDDGTNVSLTSLIAAKHCIGFGVGPSPLAAAPTETADWDPWSGGTRKSLVRVQTNTAGSILKSLVGGTQGDIVILENHGDNSGSYAAAPLLIRHHKTGDPGITAGNNIYCPNLRDIVIPYTGSAILYYDDVTVGWIMLGHALGDRFYHLVAHDISIAFPLSPSALAAGNTNNYDPTGGPFGDGQSAATWLRLNADPSGSTLTGLVPYFFGTTGNQGPIRYIQCIGGSLTLAHESASSSAANRFNFPGGKDIILQAGEGVLLIFDQQGGGSLTAARWRLLAGSTGSFPTLTLNRDATPTLAATENDWNPAGWKTTSCWRMVPAPTSLTGMQELEPGAIRVLTSFSAGLTIRHQNAGSAARNRFYCPGGADFVLNGGESATFRYDTTTGWWFCIGWTK